MSNLDTKTVLDNFKAMLDSFVVLGKVVSVEQQAWDNKTHIDKLVKLSPKFYGIPTKAGYCRFSVVDVESIFYTDNPDEMSKIVLD